MGGSDNEGELAAQEPESCSTEAFQQLFRVFVPAGSGPALRGMQWKVHHHRLCLLRFIYPCVTWDQWFWLFVRHNSLQCKCAGHFLHWIITRSFENKFCPKSCSQSQWRVTVMAAVSNSFKLAEKPLLKSTVRSPCAHRDSAGAAFLGICTALS